METVLLTCKIISAFQICSWISYLSYCTQDEPGRSIVVHIYVHIFGELMFDLIVLFYSSYFLITSVLKWQLHHYSIHSVHSLW